MLFSLTLSNKVNFPTHFRGHVPAADPPRGATAARPRPLRAGGAAAQVQEVRAQHRAAPQAEVGPHGQEQDVQEPAGEHHLQRRAETHPRTERGIHEEDKGASILRV